MLAEMMTISKQLRMAIEDSGVTQVVLAARTGVDQAAISRFLRGERSITLDSADLICRELKLKLCPRHARTKGGKR